MTTACFVDLGEEYQDFADRSRHHDVKLIKSPKNQKLAGNTVIFSRTVFHIFSSKVSSVDSEFSRN